MNKRSRITLLPGGIKITFDGRWQPFLPDATCLKCQCLRPAADFLKTWRKIKTATVCAFGSTCLWCDPPPRPFPDLRAARFRNGRHVGTAFYWRERDKNSLGPARSLRLLQVRQMADGVFRPQPKRDRKKHVKMPVVAKLEKEIAIGEKDDRRNFSRAEITKMAIRQKWICAICDEPFTLSDPPTGDHIQAHSLGYLTDTHLNGQAAHLRCNILKGTHTTEWARRRMREMKISLF